MVGYVRLQQSPLSQVSDTVVRMCRKPVSRECRKPIKDKRFLKYWLKYKWMTDTHELAYKRKAKLRKKHRKVKAELVSDMTNLNIAVRKSRKGKEGKKGVVIFDKDYNGNLLRLPL